MSGSPFSSDGSLIVSHREFITDLVSDGLAFSPLLSSSLGQEYLAINPGNALCFPWLSQMANLFESYSFEHLSFEFESSVSTSTPGSVLLAVDFDYADNSPSDKTSMMSYHNAVRSSAWTGCTYTCDKSDLSRFGKTHYVTPMDTPVGQDVKTLHTGAFYPYQSNVTAGMVGELYVRYTVALRTPQMNNSILFNNFVNNNTSHVIGGGSMAVGNRFGTAATENGDATLVTTTAINNIVKFNQIGQFLLSVYTSGTTLVNDVISSVGSGMTAVVQTAIPDATGTVMTTVILARVLLAGATAIFTLTPSAASISGCTMRVAAYGTSFL